MPLEKYKVWRSAEGEWVCILVNDGVTTSTLSLTKTEAADLRRKLMEPYQGLADAAGDAGEPERLYPLKAGHVLTEQDALDIQNMLADYNAEIEATANAFHDGRVDAFREVGGEELAIVAADRDDAMVKSCVAKALATFRAKTQQYKSETPA